MHADRTKLNSLKAIADLAVIAPKLTVGDRSAADGMFAHPALESSPTGIVSAMAANLAAGTNSKTTIDVRK